MIPLPKHYGPLLRFLHSSMDQAINTAVESMELTSAQGFLLGFLARHDTPQCPRDIEEAFRLSHPTVSGLLARLEKKGFIELRTDEKDRRCKRIHLLPKGRECTEKLYASIMETEEKLVEGFSPEERNQFRSFLERSVSNMGAWPECHKHKEEPKQ